jgi:hypothetical protein
VKCSGHNQKFGRNSAIYEAARIFHVFSYCAKVVTGLGS